MTETNQRAKVDVPLIVGALLGFGLSLYAFLQHMKLKYTSAPLGCDINAQFNCSSAYTSNWGEALGIPLGAHGMTFFGILIAIAAVPYFTHCSKRWILKYQLFALIIGTSVAAFLFKVSYFELKVICPVCTSTHAVTLLLTIYTLIKFLKVRSEPDAAEEGAFAKLLSMCLALAIPPLVAGVIVPTIAPSLAKKSEPAPPPQEQLKEQPTLAAENFEFSKSSYVAGGEDFRYGSDDAKVVIFEYFDFECPHCKVASESLHQAVDRVGKDKVLLVFRNYPLSNQCNPTVPSEGHRYACTAALAARCAGVQGKFMDMTSWLLALQDVSEDEKAKSFSEDGLVKQAQTLGLNKETFKSCLVNKTENAKIKEDARVAVALGIKGTPMIYINKKLFTGRASQPDDVVAVLENELRNK